MDEDIYYGTCDFCGYFGELLAIHKEVNGLMHREYACRKCAEERKEIIR